MPPFLRKIFLRIENFLVIIPMLCIWFVYIFFPTYKINFIIFNNTPSSILDEVVTWSIVLLITFIFHYVLRKKKLRDVLVTRTHVILSLILLILLAYLYNKIPNITQRWNDSILPPPVYDEWEFTSRIIYALWQIFFVMQIGFIIYAIRKFRIARKKASAN